MLWIWLSACNGPATDSPPVDTQDTQDTSDIIERWAPHAGGVVELLSEDGTVLVGDFYPTQTEGRPSMLLYGDFYSTRETVSQTFIDAASDEGWNVLVVDWRSFGDSGGSEYISDMAYKDIEVAISFLAEQTHGPPPAIFGGICSWALLHAYKAETLKDRTQIAGFGMMPFTDLGACNVFNPDQMPQVPTLFVVNRLDDAERPYVAAGREDWVFITDYDNLDGWARLDDPSYGDSDMLRGAILDFFQRVHGGDFE